MAEKKAGKAKATTSTTKKSKTKTKAKSKAKSASKKAPKSASRKGPKAKAKPAASRARVTSGLDKSVAEFRKSLEQSVTLSRDRIQDVVDDAVKRGRMTRGDAERMLGELVKRGRKHSDALLSELEKLIRQARRTAKKLS